MMRILGSHPEAEFWRKVFALFLASILLLLGFELLHEKALQWYPIAKTMLHLAREAGFAGLVSIFLIFTIELFGKESLRRDMKGLTEEHTRNLIKSVFSRSYPVSISAALESMLVASRVYRKALCLNLTMEYRESTVAITAELDYVIGNATATDQLHQIDIGDSSSRLVSLQVDDLEIFGPTGQVGNAKAGRLAISEDKCRVYLTVSEAEERKIKKIVHLIRGKSSSATWTIDTISDGIRGTISKPADLTVSVRTSFPFQELPLAEVVRAQRSAWEQVSLILPGHAVIVEWHPKESYSGFG